MTEHRKTRQTLAAVTRALRVLSRATEVIIRARSEKDMLEEVCKVVAVEGSYRMAWIGWAGSGGDGRSVRSAAYWEEEGKETGSARSSGDHEAIITGPAEKAIATGQSVTVRDSNGEPSFEAWGEEARRLGYRASVALPLTVGTHCYGALSVYAEDADAFDAEELELLERLADDLAFGIRSLRLKEERERLERLVRQKQRMESLGEMTGGLAHDINNLLTIILANAGVLAEAGSVDDPDFRGSLRDIVSATESGARLVRKLLASGRMEEPTFESLDLAAVTEEECRLLKRVIPETVVIEPSIEDRPLPVRADPSALNQIFLNLAFNARDAMGQSGTMRVRVRRRHVGEGEYGFHGPAVPGAYACVEVMDSGVGMNPETRERLFDPFFTTKARGRGTGLGLAVVYGLVESHDGFIQVESEPGRGTSMYVYLPLTEEEGTPSAPRTREKRVVLVADEDAHARHAAARVLEAEGYEVVSTADRGKALAVVEKRGSDLALVVLDAAIPGTEGLDLVRRLGNGEDRPPIVLMRGGRGDGLADAAELSGLTFLEKPWTAAELLAAVREARGGPGTT